jgi:hypothetical protein
MLHLKTDIQFWSSLEENVLEWKKVGQNFWENQNKRNPVNKFFTKSCDLCDNVENNVEPDRKKCALRGE